MPEIGRGKIVLVEVFPRQLCRDTDTLVTPQLPGTVCDTMVADKDASRRYVRSHCHVSLLLEEKGSGNERNVTQSCLSHNFRHSGQSIHVGVDCQSHKLVCSISLRVSVLAR